jgi:hypothetical protein
MSSLLLHHWVWSRSLKRISTQSNNQYTRRRLEGKGRTPSLRSCPIYTASFDPRAACRTNYSATAPLDHRTNERRTPIHTNGHPGPAPLESTAGFMYRTLGLRSGVDSGCWSLLHTAGPDNSGRVIRLHPLGPTAIIGAGPAGGGRINVGQPGMESAGRARTGRDLDGGSYGKMTLLTVMTYSPIGRLRRFTSTLYKGSRLC